MVYDGLVDAVDRSLVDVRGGGLGVCLFRGIGAWFSCWIAGPEKLKVFGIGVLFMFDLGSVRIIGGLAYSTIGPGSIGKVKICLARVKDSRHVLLEPRIHFTYVRHIDLPPSSAQPTNDQA